MKCKTFKVLLFFTTAVCYFFLSNNYQSMITKKFLPLQQHSNSDNSYDVRHFNSDSNYTVTRSTSYNNHSVKYCITDNNIEYGIEFKKVNTSDNFNSTVWQVKRRQISSDSKSDKIIPAPVVDLTINNYLYFTNKSYSPTCVFYNRVPKCGSTTLLRIFEKIAMQNGIRLVHSQVYTKPHINKDKQVRV